MPVIPCPEKITCGDCLDFPLSNFSAEKPEEPVFVGIFNFSGDPPLGTVWSRPGCLTICYSTMSQQAADDCALQQSQLCTWDNSDCSGGLCGDWRLPTGTPRATYHSAEQNCVIACSTGNFTFHLAAGAVLSTISQADADTRAAALCTRAAGTRYWCQTPPPACLVDLDPYEFQLGYTGQPSGTTFALVAGSLPPGLGMDSSGFIEGFPVMAGSFSFTVSAVEPTGAVLTHAMTLVVVEITTASPLPDGFVEAAYNTTLAASGTTPPVSWQVVSGVLPPGLTLHESTGVIDGTPTTDPTPPPGGTYIFTVLLQDSAS